MRNFGFAVFAGIAAFILLQRRLNVITRWRAKRYSWVVNGKRCHACPYLVICCKFSPQCGGGWKFCIAANGRIRHILYYIASECCYASECYHASECCYASCETEMHIWKYGWEWIDLCNRSNFTQKQICKHSSLKGVHVGIVKIFSF